MKWIKSAFAKLEKEEKQALAIAVGVLVLGTIIVFA
jgi:hypothetical protein